MKYYFKPINLITDIFCLVFHIFLCYGFSMKKNWIEIWICNLLENFCQISILFGSWERLSFHGIFFSVIVSEYFPEFDSFSLLFRLQGQSEQKICFSNQLGRLQFIEDANWNWTKFQIVFWYMIWFGGKYTSVLLSFYCSRSDIDAVFKIANYIIQILKHD